jgi:glycerol uptake facilitator-like aquaporin
VDRIIIAFIIMVEAPLTMACINPARDLGPHIAISILGWGAAAFPAWEDHGGSGRSAPSSAPWPVASPGRWLYKTYIRRRAELAE